MNNEQWAILDHTMHRAPRGFYCGWSDDMQVLIDNGWMVSAGTKPGVPDEYFRITPEGRKALRR